MTDMNIHTLKVIAIASVAILAAAPSFSQRQGLPDNAPNISDAEHERRVQEARDRRVDSAKKNLASIRQTNRSANARTTALFSFESSVPLEKLREFVRRCSGCDVEQIHKNVGTLQFAVAVSRQQLFTDTFERTHTEEFVRALETQLTSIDALRDTFKEAMPRNLHEEYVSVSKELEHLRKNRILINGATLVGPWKQVDELIASLGETLAAVEFLEGTARPFSIAPSRKAAK